MTKIKCPKCKHVFSIQEVNADVTKVSQLQKEEPNTYYAATKSQNNMHTRYFNINSMNKANEKEINTTMRNQVISKTNREAKRLEEAGVNPNQYVSLGDLQSILSNFFTTPVNVIGKESTVKPFAENSKFYNKLMVDGNIFNPYLHRRFLPAQYLQMMKYHPTNTDGYRNDKNFGFEAALKEYNFQYSINYTNKEVKKLAYLEWADPTSFKERSLLFTLDTVKEIIADYVQMTLVYIDKLENQFSKGKAFKHLKGRGLVLVGDYNSKKEIITPSSDIFDLKQEFKVFNRQVQKCHSYKTMTLLLQSFRFIVLPADTKKSKAFINAYKGSGAYYTIKHLIMFEKCVFKGTLTSTDGVMLLRAFLMKKTPAYVFHAMLKEMMEDNNYSY